MVEQYLELCLRLGRHVDGLVDAYYGPPEIKERVGAEALADPAELAETAASLKRSRRFYETFFGFDVDGELDGEGCFHISDAEGFDLTLAAGPERLAFRLAPFRRQGRRPRLGTPTACTTVRRERRDGRALRERQPGRVPVPGSRRLSGRSLLGGCSRVTP